MTVDRWIRDFLSHRGLDLPDGRPLYRYRCSPEELETVRGLFSPGGPSQSESAAACFCLFAAEWWRQHHRSGAWRWEEILQGVCWRDLPPLRLYATVEQGIRFWQRKILPLGDQRRGYLVTLACEGGLPLHLLHNEQARLRQYFRELLQDIPVYSRSGTAFSELAGRRADRLPRSLRNDVVFELAGQLVGGIWRLQAEVTDARDPVLELDRRMPGWREELPLVIEDETAKILLNNLVTEAVRIARRHGRSFRFQRSLQQVSGAWHFSGTLSCPPAIPAGQLGADLGRNELPRRFQLQLGGESGSRSILAVATRFDHDGTPTYALEVPARTVTRFRGAEALHARTLHAVTPDGEQYGPATIDGAGTLSDLPWTFVPSAVAEHTFDLVGDGPTTTRYLDALVALPDGWRIDSASAEVNQHHGSIEFIGRTLVAISGTTTFVDDDGNACVVELGAERDSDIEFLLRGDSLPFGPSGEPVYVGLPRVVERRLDRFIDVPVDTLEWCPAGQRSGWRSVAGSVAGVVSLRLVNGGRTRFRAKVRVLPANAAIELTPLRERGKGTIKLSDLGNAELGLEPDGQVTGQIDPIKNGFRVTLQSSGTAPTAVRVRLRWESQGELVLALPYPSTTPQLIRADGTALTHGSSLSIDQVFGCRIRILAPEGGRRFYLTTSMTAEDWPNEVAAYANLHLDIPEVAPRRYELDLGSFESDLRSRFHMSSRLDAIIRLTVEGGAPTEWLILRFGITPEPAKETHEIRLDATAQRSLSPRDLELLRFEARPIWDPGRDAVVLTRNSELSWHVPTDTLDPGPWLILGWVGNLCATRPTRWLIPGSYPGAAATSDLAAASLIADQNERDQAFRVLIDAMAGNAEHPAWETFSSYMEAYAAVPKTALDLFRHIADDPNAAAMAILRASPSEFDSLWYGLEELSFSWPYVPIRSWISAARRLVQPLKSVGAGSGLQQSLFRTFIERAPGRQPSLGVVADLMRFLLLDCEFTEIPELAALARPDLQTSLLRQRDAIEGELAALPAEDRWPPGPSPEEYQQSLPPSPELPSIWWIPQPGIGFRGPFVDATVAAALACASGVRLDRSLELQAWCIRLFAPEAFDRMFLLNLKIAISHLLKHDRDALG